MDPRPDRCNAEYTPECDGLVRAFTRRYRAAIIGLGLAAVAKFALFLVFSRSVAAIQVDLNEAGRQRMRSQRIALHLVEVLHARDDAAREAHLDDLRAAIAAMRATFASLAEGGRSGALRPDAHDGMHALFAAGPRPLGQWLTDFLERAERFANAAPAALARDEAAVLALVAEARGPLLEALDRAVEMYEQEAARRHAIQEGVEAAALGSILLVLTLVGLGVFRPMARQMQQEAARVVATEERRRQEAAQGEFTTTLYQALDMADSEEEILQATEAAMATISAGHPMELLLADSSEAHLARTAVNPTQAPPRCGVESPNRCPAVRRGHAVRFASSRALNACPRLRERDGDPCSALCVPLAFMGRALGVLHVTGPEGVPPDPGVVRRLETLAGQVGNRLGTVRSFAQVEMQASTDPLTGLLNRRSMEAEVRRVIHSGRGYAVAIADLDHFKRLNDTYGHDTGDRALVTFAKVVRQCVRAEDIVSRHGGEEFVFVFEGQSGEQATEVLDRVRARLAQVTAAGDGPTFTASFGVAEGAPGADWRAVLNAADAALLEAKARGRDRVVVAGASTGPGVVIDMPALTPAPRGRCAGAAAQKPPYSSSA